MTFSVAANSEAVAVVSHSRGDFEKRNMQPMAGFMPTVYIR